MTRAGSFFGWIPVVAVTAGLLATASCTDRLLVPPAAGVTAELALAPAPSAAMTGADAAACARADGAHVRLVHDGAVVLDTTLAISDACDRGIALQVRLGSDRGVLELSLVLLAGGKPVFQGNTQIELQPGRRADVPVMMAPVPAGLVAPDSLRTFTKLGDSVALGGAVVFATGDTVAGLWPSWADDGKGIVSVANGFARARAEGSAVLTASYEGFSRTTRLGVKAVVASVAVDGVVDSASMYVRGTRTFTAVARDSNKWVLQRVITWTSGNPQVATIGATGTAMAVGTGTTLIVAAAEARADSFWLRVGEEPVARVVVSPDYAVLSAESEQFTATTYDAAGNVLTGRSVTWSSSDSKVASVSATGLVTAVGPGSAVIAATSEGVSGHASIRVMAQPVLRVTPTVVTDTVLMFRADTVGPTLQVRNGGGGTLDGLSVTVSYTEPEAPDFIRRVTLDRTVAPANLTIVYRDTLWYEGTRTLNATLTIASTAPGTTPVSVPLTLTVLGPTLRVTPAAVYDTVYPHVEGPLDTAMLQVTNVGGGTINGLSAEVYYPGTEGYDFCLDSLHWSAPDAPATLTLFYNDTLTNGTTCEATVMVYGGSAEPVSVPVAALVRGPVIQVTPAGPVLYDTITAGQADSLVLQVANAGIGTLYGLRDSVMYYFGSPTIARDSLSSTTAPATLTLFYADTLTVGMTYGGVVGVFSTAPGARPVFVQLEVTVRAAGPASVRPPIGAMRPSVPTMVAPVAKRARPPSY